MHELSIVKGFVKMAEQYALENNAREVKLVTLEIGKLTGVVPHYVKDYYKDLIMGTVLEDSELTIEEVDGLLFCRECGTTYEPNESDLKCPHCSSQNYEILQGNKLLLKEIGFI